MASAATSVSSRSTDGTEVFSYSHGRMVRELTRYIITTGNELSLGENPIFVRLMTKVPNPNYRAVEKRTVNTVVKEEFMNLKKELYSTFSSSNHRVALSCDFWRNKDCQDYIRVTTHWIDSDWSVHRRIINFKLIESPICAASISDHFRSSIEAWEIKDKIFSVTVDDVSDEAEAMTGLKNFIHPILDGKLFRVRCVCGVLNSCIIDGLNLVSTHITKILRVVGFPFYDRERYIFLCRKYGLKPKFGFLWHDMFQWDDTREMLKRWTRYKDVLNEYIATCGTELGFDEINEQDWEVVSVYIRFLDVFHEAVGFVSRNYYPSSCGVLLHMVNIANLFSEYRGSGMFEEKIAVMEEKFLKHYDRVPDLFCLVAVMDPRIKLSGCTDLMESYYQCTNNMKVNVDEEKIAVSNFLHEMFDLYALKFSTSKEPSSSSSTTTGFAWSVISGKKHKTLGSGFNELSFYLQTPHGFEEETKDFNILAWWKTHEAIYPMLASMARDLLMSPVSTLAPDVAFNRDAERRISDKSYHLRWGMLEMYTCLRAWYSAELRIQGQREPYEYTYDEEEEEDDDDDES